MCTLFSCVNEACKNNDVILPHEEIHGITLGRLEQVLIPITQILQSHSRECSWAALGAHRHVLAWVQALEDAQGKDLLFWANRYHLFVSWSPDRSHPWDSMPDASKYVTLEIGVQRGTGNQVRGEDDLISEPEMCSDATADCAKQPHRRCMRMHAYRCRASANIYLIAMYTFVGLPRCKEDRFSQCTERLVFLQALVLLDGKPITNFTMNNGVLKTT